MNGADPRFIRTFKPSELRRIVAAAEERIANHPRTWSVDQRRRRVRNERLGIAAEWAVCEWLSVSEAPVFESLGSGGDGGSDIRLPGGRKVEVKATTHANGRLVIPPYQCFGEDFDVAVLCLRHAAATVRAAGYATESEWAEHARMVDLRRGVGPQPVLDQRHLRPFGELLG